MKNRSVLCLPFFGYMSSLHRCASRVNANRRSGAESKRVWIARQPYASNCLINSGYHRNMLRQLLGIAIGIFFRYDGSAIMSDRDALKRTVWHSIAITNRPPARVSTTYHKRYRVRGLKRERWQFARAITSRMDPITIDAPEFTSTSPRRLRLLLAHRRPVEISSAPIRTR